jgi:hypothetical protein
VVQVRVLSDVESNLASRVQADFKVTAGGDFLDSAEFAVKADSSVIRGRAVRKSAVVTLFGEQL